MKTVIEVDNLKCNGCATTIKKELKLIEGVTSVDVDNEKGLVDVSYTNEDTLNQIKAKLLSLGYQETNTLHGVNKLAANAKSYVSCAIGRLS